MIRLMRPLFRRELKPTREHHPPLAVASLALALASTIATGQTSDEPADESAPPPPAHEAESQAAPKASPQPSLSQPTFRAEPVIISATRTEKPLFDAPAFANIVSDVDFFEKNYRTVPDALRDVPGVMMQKTAHGQGSPFLRGFTGFRTLMLIDGIRLNNSVFRDGPNQYWNTVDPYSIDRLEIVKGPSSVLFGSDAIGGTVNAITKGPTGYGETFHLGGAGIVRLSSAERSYTLRGELDATWNDSLGIYGGATYKDYGDLESGAGRLPATGYDEGDVDFKLEYRLTEQARLVLAHQSVDIDDAWRTHTTIFAQPYEGTTVGSDRRRSLEQNRDLTYAQLHVEDSEGFITAARFSVSYHLQAEEQDRIRSDGRFDVQSFEAATYGAWAQFETASAIGLWTYGAEYYRDQVSSRRIDYNADGTLNTIHVQGPVADDSTYDLVGIYLQDDIPITDGLNLILGGRFNYAKVDADAVEDPVTGSAFEVEDEFDSVVGSARFALHLDDEDHWNLFGAVSQGFRAPNLSDLTRLDTARTNEIETPSPGLEPEEFISYEIGAKARFDTVFAQASYYFTDIDDMIIRQPTGQIVDGLNEVIKRNSGDGFVQGVEAEARWRFHPDWTAFGWIAWMDGQVDTFPTSAPVLVTEPIDRLMPLTGQIGLRWDAPNRDVWLEGVLHMADDADRLSTRDAEDTQRIPPGGTPGYAILSLRGGWQLSHNLSLAAAIENVTDENYRVHGSGINEPGINFVLGVRYSF